MNAEQLTTKFYEQTAELALLRILVVALCDQAPDKRRLLEAFERDSEDHSVRAMFSTLPEEFFQSLESTRQIYRMLIDDGSAKT
jgi:hypothetical protein